MKIHKMVRLAAIFLIVGFLGVGILLTGDYLYTVKHWKSSEGLRDITKIELPDSVKILEYKVSAFFSIADRPNHRWLLESENGFDALIRRVADFTLGGAEDTKLFRDDWPELSEQYGTMEVGDIIMGIGSGQETLFISTDGRFAILHAFRN